MYRFIVIVVCCLLSVFQFSTVIAEIANNKSQKYSARIKSIENSHRGKYDRTITIHMLDNVTNSEKEIVFDSYMVEVVDLYPSKDKILVVHGKLEWGGDIFTLLELTRETVIDTIWGWDASISPDRTKIAYNFRYPPHSMPLYRTSVLLVYDLTKTPEENSMDESKDNPENRGFILWPERNRKQNRYFIPAMSYEEQQHIISPIVWNHSSTHVAFLLQKGDREDRMTPTYLVVVDVSQGLLEPDVTIQEVNPLPLYKARARQEFQANEMERKIFARELRFTDDDQAVEIVPYDSRFLDENTRLIINIQPSTSSQ